MNLILLHGAVGIWDEVACLVIPATAIMGVALAVLREKAPRDDADDEADDGEEMTATSETGVPASTDTERGKVGR